MSAPDFSGLPKAEVRDKPRFWWWKATRKVLATCIAYACVAGVMLAFALAMMRVIFSLPGWLRSERPPAAWVETEASCSIQERVIHGVVGVDIVGSERYRLRLDGPVPWHSFSMDRWTLSLFRDAPPAYGYAVIDTHLIDGLCRQHVSVHLPAQH